MTQTKWFRVLRAVALAVAPIVVAKLTAACPALFTRAGALALAGGLVAAYLASRKSNGSAVASAHAGSWLVVGAVWAQFQTEITKLCGTDFLHQVPTIVVTAACVGVASLVHGSEK